MYKMVVKHVCGDTYHASVIFEDNSMMALGYIFANNHHEATVKARSEFCK